MVTERPDGFERKPIGLAARILQGGPVALLTTFDRGRANVLPVAWHTPLSVRPALVGVAIERSRHSADMLAHSEQFALNFPARRLLHHVQYLGSMTGARIDKLEAMQFETFPAVHLDVPLLTGCLAWVECEVQQRIVLGDHVLHVGLVVEVHVDPAAFGERWLLTEQDQRPLHFLGERFYSTLEGVLEARVPTGGDAPERVLQERLEEDLELTHEAQERRAEMLGELEHEVESGNVIDLSQLALRPSPNWTLPPDLPSSPPQRPE